MSYTAIVAASLNDVIGDNGKIPWHIPSDLKYFKEQTLNKKIVMGSQTYLSLPGKLKDRDIYVLSKNTELSFDGVKIIHDPNSLDAYREEEIMICGGESTYDSFSDLIDKILLTLVLTYSPGDRFFNLLKNRNYQWSIQNVCIIPKSPKDTHLTVRVELTKER